MSDTSQFIFEKEPLLCETETEIENEINIRHKFIFDNTDVLKELYYYMYPNEVNNKDDKKNI